MSYELSGKLFLKNEEVVISDRFKKREFVVLTEDDKGAQVYTEHVKFQLTQDKCDLIDKYNEGDEVTVKFNIKGNKWEKDGETSYFTNLDAWGISHSESKPKEEAPAPAPAPAPAASLTQGDNENVPF